MTAQDLKNSILQLAVQGKLVPQNPSDEPVSELLKRIQAEKERMVKEGKIKIERPLSPIADDDFSFDIPENWAWIKLGEVVSVISGTSYKSKDVCKDGVRVLRGGNLQASRVHYYDDDVFLPDSFFEAEKTIRSGDILIVASTGSKAVIGKPGFVYVTDNHAQIGAFLRIVRPLNEQIIGFLRVIFDGEFYRNHIRQEVQGMNINNVKTKHITEFVVPLPPLAEQKRIVDKIEELMPLVEEYGKVEEQLTALNADFPDKLRKSILQQAIQGKLTERDSSDEPASELLKRIRAEKERLIKEGKIKKEKTLPPITEEEMPFEIPDGWEAVRIGDVGVYKKGPFGSSITKNMFVSKGPEAVKVYEQKNAIQKDPTLGEYYIRRSYFNEKMRGFEVFPGDVIVSCAGTIGETYVMPEGIEQGIINQALMRMKIVPSLNLDYFLLYFDYVLKKSAQVSSKGSAIKNIPPFDIFKKMILPLPPVAEQQRIVDRVNELVAVCDKLK